MTVNSAMVKVAEWSDETEFIPIAAKYVRLRPRVEFERNKTYIVTTILEEPYIIPAIAEPGEILEGNAKYDGYCKDLADLISKELGINCKYLKHVHFRRIPLKIMNRYHSKGMKSIVWSICMHFPAYSYIVFLLA